MQISTAGQVVGSLGEHSHLYFLYIGVVHLIPLPYYLQRVLGLIEKTSVESPRPEDKDVQQTTFQHASFGVFYPSTVTCHTYIM